ncbi:MAG: type II secretion system minor pseudopilin GspK [Sedimenticola sp.]
MKGPHLKSRGAALVTVLLIVTLATVATVGMTSRQRVDIHRTENLLLADQAYLYGQAIESWAVGILNEDRLSSKQDSLSESWAVGRLEEEVENGTVRGQITDLQARFNLNNLVSDGKLSNFEVQRFKRLLVALDLDPGLSDAIIDWLDADLLVRYPNGAEDEYYSLQQPPYRAANRPFSHISELRLVKGVTDEIFKRMEPFVSTLPIRLPINVNAAPAEVLMMLAEDMSRSNAEAILSSREQSPFENLDDLLKHNALAGLAVTKEGLAVSSTFFLLQGHSRFGKAKVTLSSVISRPVSAVPRVIQRFRGDYAGY